MTTNLIIKKQKTVYFVWIIPMIALAIAGWLYIKHQKERGTDITVVFDSIEGIEAGKTKLVYNGFQLGVVTKIDINPDNILQGIVTINVFPPADQSVARDGTRFYKVEPKVGITGITGLGTLFSGSYIKAYSSETSAAKLQERPFKDYFVADKDEPIEMIHSGRYVYMESDEALTSDETPIFYKGTVVGKILETKIESGKTTYIGVIEAPCADLVKKTSRFWVASGVDFRASLAGVRLKTGSWANIVAGGVAFSSPQEGEVLQGDDKTRFTLHPSEESISLDTQLVTLKAKKGFNLDPELNALYYRGVKAGKIHSVDYDPAIDETMIRIRLKKQYTQLLNENAHFWIVEPKIDLKGVQGLDAVASGAYLTFDSAAGGKTKSEFILHEAPPLKPGGRYRLVAENIGTLKVGAPVSMKGIKMGMVTDVRLSENMNDTIVEVLINEPFDQRINGSTMFYLQRAVDFKVDLAGLTLKTGSLENFLIGGVEFETFDREAKPAKSDFALYADRASAQEALYLKSGGKRFVLESDALVSLKEGAVVYYHEFPAGKVLKSRYNPENDRSEIAVYIEPGFADKVDSDTVFFKKSAITVDASIGGVKVDVGTLDTILQGAVAFKNPAGGSGVKEGHRFILHESLYHAENRFIEVVLKMEETYGTKNGSSVKYKGLKIGEVKSQQLKEGYLESRLLIDEAFAPLLVRDTGFWIEGFKADINGIKNTDAAIAGSEIHLMPGRSESASVSFELSPAPPPPTFGKDGLRIVAVGSRRSSLDVGSPVYYRQVKIGQIESYHLSQNGNGVEFTLFIDPCYRSVVRKNSIVYLPSAIGVDVGLSGAKIRTETVQTMIYGGIGIINPKEASAQAQGGEAYRVEDDVEEKWYTWQSHSPIRLECSDPPQSQPPPSVPGMRL